MRENDGRAENSLTETERSWEMPVRVMRVMRVMRGDEDDEDDAVDERSVRPHASHSPSHALSFFVYTFPTFWNPQY